MSDTRKSAGRNVGKKAKPETGSKKTPSRSRSGKAPTVEERDRKLVALAKKGDTDAFGRLMVEYQSKIYRLARRMTETDEDAEDVLQEAFIKAFRSLGGFKGKSKFSTWLYRITVNLALMKLRKRKIDAVSLDEPISTDEGTVQREIEDETRDPLQELIESESKEILDQAIADLPKTYRAVFVLRHVEGLSTEETARIMNITVPAVKSRLHRTRLLLQEKLFGHLKNQRSRRNSL